MASINTVILAGNLIGKGLLFDELDAELLAGRRWRLNDQGYAVAFDYLPADPSKPMSHRNRIHRIIRMHRLIMSAPDGVEVDHINRNRLDNRRCNLRFASSSLQKINTGLRSDNRTGIRGVCWDRTRNRYMATIRLNNKQINLGRFRRIEEAIQTRREAEIQYFGAHCLH